MCWKAKKWLPYTSIALRIKLVDPRNPWISTSDIRPKISGYPVFFQIRIRIRIRTRLLEIKALTVICICIVLYGAKFGSRYLRYRATLDSLPLEYLFPDSWLILLDLINFFFCPYSWKLKNNFLECTRNLNNKIKFNGYWSLYC